MASPRKDKYDIALSFAGEDRAFAKRLYAALKKRGLDVFYDKDAKAALWGKDIYDQLSEIFGNKAEYCIMLISAHYAKKMWTSHERKAAQARAFKEKDEYILPVRLDETEISGLPQTVSYLSWPPEDENSIAECVLEKIGKSTEARVESEPERPSIKSYQTKLETIYGQANRRLTVEYLYSYLCRTVGYLSKKVAQNKAMPTDFIRSISFILSLSSKLGINVQAALFSRFPRCCPMCVQEVCVCFKTKQQPPEYLPAYKVNEELKYQYGLLMETGEALDLEFACNLLYKIFPHNHVIWSYAGPWHHFSKISEELAEIHEAIASFMRGKKRLHAVAEEIADLLAWLLSAWKIEFTSKNLDDEFYTYYYEGCPVCNRSRCRCISYGGRPDGLVQPSALANLSSLLEELLPMLQTEDSHTLEHLRDVQKSLQEAVETQNDSLSRLAIAQLHYTLEEVQTKDKNAVRLITGIREAASLQRRA